MILSSLLSYLIVPELILFSIVILPFPSKSQLFIAISKAKAVVAAVTSTTTIGAVFIIFHLIVSFQSSQHHSALNAKDRSNYVPAYREKELEADRDIALSLLALILWGATARHFSILVEKYKLEISTAALEKQAKSANDASQLFLSELDQLKKKDGKAAKKSEKDKETSDASKAPDDKEHELRVAAEKRATQAQTSVDAIKAQSESQHREYERVLAENAKLKLAIEDYEIMFGDQKKKKA